MKWRLSRRAFCLTLAPGSYRPAGRGGGGEKRGGLKDELNVLTARAPRIPIHISSLMAAGEAAVKKRGEGKMCGMSLRSLLLPLLNFLRSLLYRR